MYEKVWVSVKLSELFYFKQLKIKFRTTQVLRIMDKIAELVVLMTSNLCVLGLGQMLQHLEAALLDPATAV